MATACSSRAGGDQVARLSAVGAQVVIRPAAALLLGEGAANTSAAIDLHGADTVGWDLGWGVSLAVGVVVLLPLRLLLLLLLLLLRIPVLPGCQVGLHVHGCGDVGLESGRHITLASIPRA